MSKDEKPPFSDFDFTKLIEAWQQNPFVKSIMENEFVKKLQDHDFPDFDFDSIRQAQEKNLAALRAMGEKSAASMGVMLEKQSELVAEAIAKMKDYADKASDFDATDLKSNMEEMQANVKHAVERAGDFGEIARKDGAELVEIASARLKESVNELEDFVQKIRSKIG